MGAATEEEIQRAKDRIVAMVRVWYEHRRRVNLPKAVASYDERELERLHEEYVALK